MGKVSSAISVIGTNGDDILHIPSGYDITQVSVNGRGGTDTLDLSTYQAPSGPTGVYLSESGTTSQPDSAVSDWSFVGVPGSSSSYGHLAFGTIQSIEDLIGTSGNDWLSVGVTGMTSTRLDGGAGNDYLSASNVGSATLIGGTGSDWIYSVVSNSTLIGGSLINGVVHEDPQGTAIDTFEVGAVNVNILDFQVGTDRLLFDAWGTHPAFTGGTWVDNGTGGATLTVSGAARVTLDGVSASAAQSIAYGFEYLSTSNGTFEGGPTNDVLNCNNNYAETVVTGPGTGSDLVLSFDKTHDALDFASDTQVTWSNTFVNGQESLLGTFAGGSVTLPGLTTADVSSGALHIQGLVTPATIDPTDHMSWWSVPSDAALI